MTSPFPNDTLPCPCCGSSNLTANLWSLNNGEADAVECNDCLAGAPNSSWQKSPLTLGDNQEITIANTNSDPSGYL